MRIILAKVVIVVVVLTKILKNKNNYEIFSTSFFNMF